jgi:acylphosphatase
MATVRRHLFIEGQVQGVGFRVAAARRAQALGVAGSVRNLPDGRVEAAAEGDEAPVRAFEAWCRLGPPAASVSGVEATDEPPRGERSFHVRT